MTVVATLLAHQGGWDEILLVLTPIALFAGLLWLANARAEEQLRRRAGTDHDDGEPDRTDTDDAGDGSRDGDVPDDTADHP